MNILVSACLLGHPCRYDGKSKPHQGVMALGEQARLIPVCPELLGGLRVPHPASELRAGRVFSKAGDDVTEAFLLGAEKTLALARRYDCRYAVLKERSPSCGSGEIYDGSFSGRLVPGYGMAADLLRQNGIRIFGESELASLLALL